MCCNRHFVNRQALRPPAVSPRTYCRMPNENRITSGMDAVMYAAILGTDVRHANLRGELGQGNSHHLPFGRGDRHQRPHELVVGRDQPHHGHGDQDGDG